jgi:lipopolysaccharide export system permease protein
MKIIPRYILRHFIPVLALTIFAFVGLYLVVDFFERVDDLLDKPVAMADVCLYFLLKVPLIVTQGIPVAVLVATVTALGMLKRNRELIGMRAAGISATLYAGPIVVAALLFAVFHFGLTETVARSMNQKAQHVWDRQIRHKDTPLAWSHENVWYHSRDMIYQIMLYDQKRQTLEKVSLFYLSPEFKLVKRLDAKRFRWESDRWVAEDGLILTFNGQNVQQEWFAERPLDLPQTPKDFAALETLPEELDWLSLYQYSKKIRGEGYGSAAYDVELHLRVAFSMTTFILALLGISIALRQGLHSGIAWGLVVSLAVAFIYLAVLQVGCSLATAEILPPFLGVWAGNIIFAALSYYLWITDRQ